MLADLPRTGVFTVRTIDETGHQSTAATYLAVSSGRAELTGATSSKIDDIDRVEIVTHTGVTVLSNWRCRRTVHSRRGGLVLCPDPWCRDAAVLTG